MVVGHECLQMMMGWGIESVQFAFLLPLFLLTVTMWLLD